VRAHIAANISRLRAIVESPAFRRGVTLEGEKLTRVPRGFPRDHEAAEYLKFKQFVAGAALPADAAVGPKFYSALVRIFRQVLPLSRFLNEPLRDR